MLTLIAENCAIDPLSSQTQDYKISICCFSSKHTALMSKKKDWLVHDFDQNVGHG